MTWEISKDFHFSASHQLRGLADGHPCGRMHGHNYLVRVALIGNVLDRGGFILDYGDLKPFGSWIDTVLDHRHLNDVTAFGGLQPSAENLAQWLHTVLHELVMIPPGVTATVSVSETPKTWARFTP